MKSKKVKLKNTSNFRYTGKVSITVSKKGQEVNSKLLYNSGTPALYKLVALCIADRLDEAKTLKPIYLNIYNFAGETESDIDVEVDFADDKKQNLTRLIPQSPIAVKEVYSEWDSTKIIGYAAVLKFTVPLIQVQIDQSSPSEEQLNLLGLFNSRDDLSAYVLVTDEETHEKKSIIPESLYTSSADLNDYILSVQWEMQFINE